MSWGEREKAIANKARKETAKQIFDWAKKEHVALVTGNLKLKSKIKNWREKGKVGSRVKRKCERLGHEAHIYKLVAGYIEKRFLQEKVND